MKLEPLSTAEHQIRQVSDLFPVGTSRQDVLTAIYREGRGNHHSSQTARMALALRTLGTVSTFECRHFLDIYCPPARKFDLVKDGYVIDTHWQNILAESGEPHRVGLYVLKSRS